ncbi:MAG: hypothetical protein Q8M83_03095 [bacterium]|nr:hypothetical protein [bacterium]
MLLNVHLNKKIEKGQLLYTLFAESKGELNYALKYEKHHHDDLLTIQ